MRIRNGWRGIAAFCLLLGIAGTADAARLRFHYVVTNPNEAMTLAPSAFGTPAVRITLTRTCPDNRTPRPTCVKTFRHPCTGQMVNVPLNLPGNPKVYYRTDRVLYDYSGDFVEVYFLQDGSVDVVYGSGFLRGI